MLKFFVKKAVLLFLLFITTLSLNAQPPVEMADGMRSNGKIYVVVAVLAVILTGLFIFLISIDRKVTRLEKEKSKQ
ncbi:MAG: CcmD family protein [Chitinophagaceae bacterium]|nr:CcmD family protein [Chitinophagaceae bacterium]